MLTAEQFADQKRLASGDAWRETLEFLGGGHDNLKAAVIALHTLASDLSEAQRKLEIDRRAMEIVAHFIKDHDLFAQASASIIQVAKAEKGIQ